uniref:L-type lectin-like domain-containing protein n=1 Tax=Globodera pallida TaxID=36090 RepID=A0A183C4B6_GLOPA
MRFPNFHFPRSTMVKMSALLHLCLFVSLSFHPFFAHSDPTADAIDSTPVGETRGYLKREHTLVKPYQYADIDLPFWDIVGSAILTPQHIRLTSDLQSLRGGLWNKVPNSVRDWEMVVSFKVHGSTGALFGGPGNFFRGLGIFLDTYSNHNGPHQHAHPYISAMVSNGTLQYDHDADGTHTQLGGEHTGCEAKFRNKEHDTQVLIRYVADTLSVFTDITGAAQWRRCFSVDGVILPSNFYFGITAATGELSDNHDVLSVRMFEQEYARVEKPFESVNRDSMDPIAAPRDHVPDRRPSKLGWIGSIFLVLIGLAVVVGVLGFGLFFFQKRQERARKRKAAHSFTYIQIGLHTDV